MRSFPCTHNACAFKQSFRDIKSERIGLDLSASRFRSGKRLEIQLLKILEDLFRRGDEVQAP